MTGFLLGTRLVNFLGFEFLTRNEEKNEFPHEERGIFRGNFFGVFSFKNDSKKTYGHKYYVAASIGFDEK